MIKGRVATKDEYLDTGRFERLGRIRSLERRDREICWQLREAWALGRRDRETACFETGARPRLGGFKARLSGRNCG